MFSAEINVSDLLFGFVPVLKFRYIVAGRIHISEGSTRFMFPN